MIMDQSWTRALFAAPLQSIWQIVRVMNVACADHVAVFGGSIGLLAQVVEKAYRVTNARYGQTYLLRFDFVLVYFISYTTSTSSWSTSLQCGASFCWARATLLLSSWTCFSMQK